MTKTSVPFGCSDNKMILFALACDLGDVHTCLCYSFVFKLVREMSDLYLANAPESPSSI